MNKRISILITGAAGFIGSNLANFLHTNHRDDFNLYLVDNLSFGYMENLIKELRDNLIVCNSSEFVKQHHKEMNVIIHLAGISSLPECESSKERCIHENVLETISLLEFCKEKNCKFIFASTSAVYENSISSILMESEKVFPTLSYAISKYTSEMIINNYKNLFNVNTIICRFFNVYGPNQNSNRKNPPFTSYLIKCVLDNTEAKIFNLRDDVKRDYIFVDDVIDILHILITSNEYNGETFNITSGLSYSTLEIVNTLKCLINNNDFKVSQKDIRNFWKNYSALENINCNIIEHEIFKQSIGCNKKLKYCNIFKKNFINIKEGLSMILNNELEKRKEKI